MNFTYNTQIAISYQFEGIQSRLKIPKKFERFELET